MAGLSDRNEKHGRVCAVIFSRPVAETTEFSAGQNTKNEWATKAVAHSCDVCGVRVSVCVDVQYHSRNGVVS